MVSIRRSKKKGRGRLCSEVGAILSFSNTATGPCSLRLPTVYFWAKHTLFTDRETNRHLSGFRVTREFPIWI